MRIHYLNSSILKEKNVEWLDQMVCQRNPLKNKVYKFCPMVSQHKLMNIYADVFLHFPWIRQLMFPLL
jgi:hypothetical protein